MYKQIYPVIGDEKKLPFYVVGLGLESWQFPIKRADGYEYPQIFLSRSGEGEVIINGETTKIPPDTVFYIPPFCPHEYHALSDAWYLDWIAFSGSQVIPLLEQWKLNKFTAIQGVDMDRLRRIITRIYYTLKSDKLYGNHYASAQLYDFLIEYRKIADNRLSSFYTAQSVALADVLQYIEEHYPEQIKLNELAKIADSGLTTGNLEMTYKLIDMYKDIKNTQYWDKKVEYYNAVLDEMRGGYNDDYSERGRKRDSMGRYSTNDGRMMPDYDRGSSYARRGEHYVRGHYSRSDGRDAYDDYMMQKQSYRSGKSEDCKRKMLAALEEHLDELTTEMSDMSKDAECREERDLVKRYVEKLRDML